MEKGKGKGVFLGGGGGGEGSFRHERNTRVVSRPNSLPLPFRTPATQANLTWFLYVPIHEIPNQGKA